jgi:UDP-GlcNAc:undecaprenyl-phosphate GlcNAc-1-phosphate transferase
MALAAAGVVMALDGTVVDQLGNLLGFGVLYLGWLAIPFTLVAYAGVVNATNMIDGVDGLSSGIGLLALLGISLLWIASGPAPLDATLLLGAAVLLPFFVRNFRWYPSRQPAAFMGDSGTMVLGFLLAWGCVRGATVGGIPPVSLLLVAGVPLLDMWTVMARRMRVGRSPFTPGLDHLHHRLLAKGFDARETTLILCTLAVALMAVALGVALEVLAEWVGFGLFAVTLVGALVFMNGHPEPELKSLPTSRPQNLLKPGVSSYPDR